MTTSLHGARAFVCAFADDDNVVRLDRLFLALGLGKNDIKYLEKEHASANSDHDALAASVQAITDPVCFGTLFFFQIHALLLSHSLSPPSPHTDAACRVFPTSTSSRRKTLVRPWHSIVDHVPFHSS